MGADFFDEVPSRDAYIESVFGASGYLAGRFAGYRPRAGQVALARAVDKAIGERSHLLAEGPTGTGKSLAYAVPATFHAATRGMNVLLVTANIALQEQLMEKDLPLLAEVLPWSFSFAMLKGRNNYLCVDRYYEDQATGQNFADNEEDRRHLRVIREWSRESIESGVEAAAGDVSELPFEPPGHLWRRFSVASDECKREKCASREECFGIAAHRRAKGSQIVVTNYHMLFAGLHVWQRTGADLVVPPFDVAILDEAHKAADIARDFFGFKITLEAVKRLGRRLGRDNVTAERLATAATHFFYTLTLLKKDKERYNTRLRVPLESREWQTLDAALVTVELALRAATEFEVDRGKQGSLENDAARANTMRANIGAAVNLSSDGNVVYFLDEDDKGRISICAKLVHPGAILAECLFAKTKNFEDPDTKELRIGPPVAVVATSATLCTTPENFEYAADELGVKTYATLTAESPFTWEDQCLFVVPEGLVAPNDQRFADVVAKTMAEIIDITGGRTLGLFTSRRVLNHTYDHLVGRGHRILKQGDAPRTKLIETFKNDIGSVLLGTESFWAGVDVPGESLSCVVIDRLPFPTPDDPVVDMISSRDPKWFWNYAVPRAVIAFKQGFGRLIRSVNDRGVVVCLDSRLTEKRYGKTFLKALPAIPKSTRLDSIGEWLAPKTDPRLEL